MVGRGTRSKKNVTRPTIYKEAATQTSPVMSAKELDHLKEEVDLLRRELDKIKKNQEPKSGAENKQEQQKEEVTVVAVADSPQTQKILHKGCACKGQCSSRVCGCVKKQISCTAACKCQYKKCQNKEMDKENIGTNNAEAKISSEVEENTKLLSKLGLRKNLEGDNAKGVAGPSFNKLLDQAAKSTNSIFSPDSSGTHEQDISVSNLNYDTPIKFGTSKNNVLFNVDHGSSSPKEKIEPKKKPARSRLRLHAQKSEPKSVKSDALEKKKSKLLQRMYHNENKTRGFSSDFQVIKGSQIRSENISAEEKVEPKDMPRVSLEVAANISENSEQPEVQRSLYDELELETINPMKPTRQLQRTPVSASVQINRSRISDLPVPFNGPVETEKPSIIAPPEGINEPHVNWEEHCAQLVPCRFCNRTFYPFRIETHEASCKRI